MNTAVLLLSAPRNFARKGAVAAICQFLIAHNGSVLHSDDHLDGGRDLFLSRLEWDLDGFDIPISEFEEKFKPLAEQFQINYHLALTAYRPKIAILVSSYDHCLQTRVASSTAVPGASKRSQVTAVSNVSHTAPHRTRASRRYGAPTKLCRQTSATGRTAVAST